MGARQRPVALLTGGGGFVGAWMLRRLNESGHFAVFGGNASERVDVTNPEATNALFQSVQPDVVIHLAAIASPSSAGANPQLAWDVNVRGTLNVAQALLQTGRPSRLIFVGSAEEYGATFISSPSGRVNESSVLAPTSVYGATKAAAGLLLRPYRYQGLEVVAFRPFNHTGPGQTADYVVSAFARQIALIELGKQEPVLQVGNLEAERDFIDVRDVVRAYELAALAQYANIGEPIFNLGSGAPISVRQILTELLTMTNSQIDVAIDQAKWRPAVVPIATTTIEAAKNRLNWRSEIPLRRTLEDVLSYWRRAESYPETEVSN